MSPRTQAPPATPGETFVRFLEAAIRCVLKEQSFDALRSWMQRHGAELLFAAFPDDPPPTDARDRIALAVALGLWNELPLPRNGYRPEPIARPKRNDPCLCGSGRKSKQCCGTLVSPVEVPTDMLWGAVIQQLPKREVEQLAQRRLLPPPILGAVARDLLHHGQEGRAVKLLEPLLARPEALDDRHEEAIDTLLDAYDALARTDDKMRAMHLLAEKTRPAVRVPVLLRECSIALDEGDYPAARKLFETAQRLDPDHLQLATSETLILLSSGEVARAQERARFWIARLRRAQLDEEEGPIPFLREVAADPERAMVRHDHEVDADLAERLLDLADAAADRPLPGLEGPRGLRTADEDGALLVLQAHGALAAIEERWEEVWEQGAPALTDLSAEPSHDFDVWEPIAADAWLGLVESDPAALDSFVVLDGLAQAVMYFGSFPTPWVDRRLLAPFVVRSHRLLADVVAASPGARVPWPVVGNRPALRGVARLIDLRLRQRNREVALELARFMLALNPFDNHGFRGLWANELLARGEAAALLELCARYPDDMLVEIAFGRVAALFLASRSGDALQALAGLQELLPHVGPKLLEDDPKPPRKKDLSPYGVVRGGVEEAWIYRREAGAAWRSHPELWQWFSVTMPALAERQRQRQRT